MVQAFLHPPYKSQSRRPYTVSHVQGYPNRFTLALPEAEKAIFGEGRLIEDLVFRVKGVGFRIWGSGVGMPQPNLEPHMNYGINS